MKKMYKTVNWKTGPARARYNLELKTKKNKKLQATSVKRRAGAKSQANRVQMKRMPSRYPGHQLKAPSPKQQATSA